VKVLLIYPPATVYGSGLLSPSIPMGLLSLVAYLKEKNIDVIFLDALAENGERKEKNHGGTRYGMSKKAIARVIVECKPDLVGISTMFTAYFEDSIETAEIVKKVNKDIMVVVGGSHVSIDPVEACKSKYVDVAVFGEGEETLYELACGVNLKKIDGIVYKIGKRIVKNPSRELIGNLDDLPMPAWEVLSLNKYTLGGSFNMRFPVFPIISSRGCPGHCLYCSVNSVWNHRWRGRSAKLVVDEMEYLFKEFGAREFSFQDDSVSVDKARMEAICSEIIKRKLDIRWNTPNGIAHWTLSKDLLKKMKQSGCYRITFGIESGDKEMRSWVGKPYSLEQAMELTKFANKIGIWTLATNIIGFPFETRENIYNTLNFAIGSDVDLAFFFRLGPRPGTPIYEIFKKRGWLMKNKKMLFSEDVACRTKYFSGKEIIEMQNDLYKKFFWRRWFSLKTPGRILKKIKSWEDLRYVLRIGWIGVKLGTNLVSSKVGVTSKTLRV
jgi:radical SAM superfamily enzyme YgiQ (UPF0313 family)